MYSQPPGRKTYTTLLQLLGVSANDYIIYMGLVLLSQQNAYSVLG